MRTEHNSFWVRIVGEGFFEIWACHTDRPYACNLALRSGFDRINDDRFFDLLSDSRTKLVAWH